MRSWCEWKGQASYLDVVVGDQVLTGIAWTYPEPSARFEALRDHVALYPGGWTVHRRRRGRAAAARELLRRLDHLAGDRTLQGRARHLRLVTVSACLGRSRVRSPGATRGRRRSPRTPLRECAAVWQSSSQIEQRALGAVKLRTGGDRGDSEVRDPTTASGRLTRWESWTDGQSPDEKRTQTAPAPPGAHRPRPRESATGPKAEDDDQRGRAASDAPRPRARGHPGRTPRTEPAGRVRAACAGRHDDRRGLPPPGRRRRTPRSQRSPRRGRPHAVRRPW